MTFEEALAASIVAPEVEAVRATFRERVERDDGIGGLTSDPKIEVVPGYRFGTPTSNDGFDGAFGVSQSFNLSGYGSARQRAATEERDLLGIETRLAELYAQAAAGRAWLSARARTIELELHHDLVREADDVLRIALRRSELGMGGKIELAQARAFAARTKLQQLDAEGRAFDAELDLAAAVGAETGPVVARGDEPDFLEPDIDEVFMGAAASPERARAERRLAAARAREKEAAKQGGFELQSGAFLATEPPGDLIPFAVLGLRVPAFDGNRRAAAQSAGLRAEAAVEVDAASRTARRRRAEMAHELTHARAVEQLHRDELLPALRAESSAIAKQFELGDAPLRLVLLARLRLLEGEIALVRAHERYKVATFDVVLLQRAEEP